MGIKAIASLATIYSLAGCQKKDSISEENQEIYEKVEEVAHKAAIVGVFVGSALKEIPHPAMRIVSVVLIIGSELIISYIDFQDVNRKKSFQVNKEESELMQGKAQITLKRQDGADELRAIDKVEY